MSMSSPSISCPIGRTARPAWTAPWRMCAPWSPACMRCSPASPSPSARWAGRAGAAGGRMRRPPASSRRCSCAGSSPWPQTEGLDYNLIEAFDQGWKYKSEGTVGAAWGLWTEGREPKFPLHGPVRENPDWALVCRGGGAARAGAVGGGGAGFSGVAHRCVWWCWPSRSAMRWPSPGAAPSLMPSTGICCWPRR